MLSIGDRSSSLPPTRRPPSRSSDLCTATAAASGTSEEESVTFPAVMAWLASVLPTPITEIADRSWPDGKSSVHHVRDASGVEWFAKHHRGREWYLNEVNAYRRWVPTLGDRAPKLLAHHDSLRAVVVSALRVAGSQDWRDDDLRREAGALLRRLHDVESFGRWDDIAEAKHVELDRWLRRGRGLLTANEVDVATACARELAHLPKPERVPCHHDYTPRNWVINHGRVQLIDFEETYPDAWMTDIVRMTIGFWKEEPHLTEAILDGYGRRLSADDEATSVCLYAINAVRYVVLGTELGKHDFVERTRQVLRHLAPGRR